MITLANACDDDLVCWLSHETIAERAECSDRAVRKHLNALQEAGLISVKNRARDGMKRSNLYTLHPVFSDRNEVPASPETTENSDRNDVPDDGNDVPDDRNHVPGSADTSEDSDRHDVPSDRNDVPDGTEPGSAQIGTSCRNDRNEVPITLPVTLPSDTPSDPPSRTPPMPPQGGGGGDPADQDESGGDVDELSALFEEFMENYPRKENREAAEREFLKLDPTRQFLDELIKDIWVRIGTGAWIPDSRAHRFIPAPATYLRDARWNDEVVPRSDADEVRDDIDAWRDRRAMP